MICNTCRTIVKDPRKHSCISCGVCRTKCQCRQRKGYLVGGLPSSNWGGAFSSSTVLNSTRAIGLELEIADWGSWDRSVRLQSTKYEFVRDGTVIPSNQEAVLSPVAGDRDILRTLKEVAWNLMEHGCSVNHTCGYHVHINASDVGWYELRRLWTLYYKLENDPNFFKILGRPAARFAASVDTFSTETMVPSPVTGRVTPMLKALWESDHHQHIQQVFQAALWGLNYRTLQDEVNYVKDVQRKRKEKIINLRAHCPTLMAHLKYKDIRGWNRTLNSRYLALNIHSWHYRGSVEWRGAAGSVEPGDVMCYPLFALWVTEAAFRTTDSWVRESTIKVKDLIQLGAPQIIDGRVRQNYLPSDVTNWVMGKIK